MKHKGSYLASIAGTECQGRIPVVEINDQYILIQLIMAEQSVTG